MMMTNKKIVFLLLLVICTILLKQSASLATQGENTPPQNERIEVRLHFSCYHCHIDWNQLTDLKNNPILNACIAGATFEELKDLNVDDLDTRLEKLQEGNVIKQTNGRYFLAFPAIVGGKRAKLQQIIEQTVAQLMPTAKDAVKQLRHHLNQQPEMLFHVLWSIVMDSVAWQTVQTEFNSQFNKDKVSLEGVGWLMYPSHPYDCGTNTYNDLQIGTVKITWSMTTALTPSAPWVLHETIKKYDIQLMQSLTTGQPIKNQQVRQDLAQYGLVDDIGQLTAYIIDPNSQAAQTYWKLGLEFGRKAMTHLDIQKIADILDVTLKQAVVIAYHELCYEILKQLVEKGTIRVPGILLNPQAGTSQTHHLISIIERVNDPNSLKYPQQ